MQVTAIKDSPRSASPERGAAPETVIQGHGVTMTFGGGSIVALQSATFGIGQGRFVSLVGPSGCGKSTLLRLIAGLTRRSSGSLKVHGAEVDGPSDKLGLMFQKSTLLDWRTAVENVLLPTELSGRVTKADRNEAMDLLRMVGLAGFEFSFPSQLSGGMQQRVALARLLKQGVDVLLLDEPFGALDEFTRERLNVELMRIVADVGATAVFVTHSITEAIFLADEVMVMTPRPGRIAAQIEVPFERPRDPSIQQSSDFNALVSQVRDVFAEHD